MHCWDMRFSFHSMSVLSMPVMLEIFYIALIKFNLENRQRGKHKNKYLTIQYLLLYNTHAHCVFCFGMAPTEDLVMYLMN